MVPALRTNAAMRTFHAGLKALVSAVRARYQVSLRPGEQINDQADKVEEKDKRHPENRAVHATRFRVSGHPHQQGDAERKKQDGHKDECAATTGASRIACRVSGAVLCI